MRAYVGNVKWRGFRLDTGNYSWGSEAVTRKTRIPDVVYNASNSELVRTQTLVKLFRLMQHHSNSGTFSIMEWILDGRRRPQQLLRRTRKVMLRARRRRRATMSAGS